MLVVLVVLLVLVVLVVLVVAGGAVQVKLWELRPCKAPRNLIRQCKVEPRHLETLYGT